MKKMIPSLLLAVVFTAAPLLMKPGNHIGFIMPSYAAEQQYTCPMHPHYVADRPGSCPICGMDLVPVEGGEDEADVNVDANADMQDQDSAKQESVGSAEGDRKPADKNKKPKGERRIL